MQAIFRASSRPPGLGHIGLDNAQRLLFEELAVAIAAIDVLSGSNRDPRVLLRTRTMASTSSLGIGSSTHINRYGSSSRQSWIAVSTS